MEPQKILKRNKNKLKELGFDQAMIGIWVAFKTNRSKPYSQTTISNWFKYNKNQTMLLTCTNSLLKDLQKPLGEREWDKIVKGDLSKGRLTTWSSIVDDFTSLEIENFKSNRTSNEKLVVEAMGMKLSSLLKVFQTYLQEEALPESEIHCVLIDPNESGIKYRGIIEGNRADYNLSIKAGFHSWKEFNNSIKKSSEFDSSIKIRLLKPDPNFYMIKVFDKMLVSVYLRDIGNTNHSEIIDKNIYPKRFNDYYNMFLQYYSNDELSSTLQWNHSIFTRDA